MANRKINATTPRTSSNNSWESRAIVERTIVEAEIAADLFCYFLRENGAIGKKRVSKSWEPTPEVLEIALGFGIALRLGRLEEILGLEVVQAIGLPAAQFMFNQSIRMLRGESVEFSSRPIAVSLLHVVFARLSWRSIGRSRLDLVLPQSGGGILIKAVAELLWRNRHSAQQGAE